MAEGFTVIAERSGQLGYKYSARNLEFGKKPPIGLFSRSPERAIGSTRLEKSEIARNHVGPPRPLERLLLADKRMSGRDPGNRKYPELHRPTESLHMCGRSSEHGVEAMGPIGEVKLHLLGVGDRRRRFGKGSP